MYMPLLSVSPRPFSFSLAHEALPGWPIPSRARLEQRDYIGVAIRPSVAPMTKGIEGAG